MTSCLGSLPVPEIAVACDASRQILSVWTTSDHHFVTSVASNPFEVDDARLPFIWGVNLGDAGRQIVKAISLDNGIAEQDIADRVLHGFAVGLSGSDDRRASQVFMETNVDSLEILAIWANSDLLNITNLKVDIFRDPALWGIVLLGAARQIAEGLIPHFEPNEALREMANIFLPEFQHPFDTVSVAKTLSSRKDG